MPKPCSSFRSTYSVLLPLSKHSKLSGNFLKSRRSTQLSYKSGSVLCASRPGAAGKGGDNGKEEDFMSRVLKENPSQIEPRFLIGNKFYTLKEKQDLSKESNMGPLESLSKKLKLRTKSEREVDEAQNQSEVRSDSVYLKDILREYKGKLYVPEQVFSAGLSEEEEFDRSLENLPRMSFEEFQKAAKYDKVKLLTSKEPSKGVVAGSQYRDFIVDLKEIPGDKSLQRTKWCVYLLYVAKIVKFWLFLAFV